MDSEKKGLTLLGKLVVFVFVAACFAGAYHLLTRGGLRVPFDLPWLSKSGVAPHIGGPAPSAEPPASPTLPAENVWEEVRRRGELVVGHEDDTSAPMYFRGPDGRLQGFEYDLALRLSAELGIPSTKFVTGDYVDLPEMLRQRRIDVILAGYVPDPSIRGVDWSDSYLDFGLCLVVLKSSAVSELSHLEGRTVAVYDDPAAIDWVRKNVPNVTVKTYSGTSGWFEALERREVDALIYDYPFAAAEIREHPRAKIVRFNLNTSRYAMGVLAGNDALLDALNGGLKKLMGSPAYRDLMLRYLDYQAEGATRRIAEAGTKTYTVIAGDTLGSIAARRLGSGDRWPEIWKLNRERVPNPHLIHPGYVLLMP
ncbi:MAG: transporter substrate-binding domain-containing protein [Deltaproteobacteria bacterium]|nr:transporter substrate-binding domain-containing protein [Deltaproteobacteria bacterium]